MKRFALIVPNNIWVSPYVNIYTRVFDEMCVDYDVISWNRDGRSEQGIQFNYNVEKRKQYLVLWSYMKFARFTKKNINKNGYDKLVIFSPQVGIFLSSFLARKYRGRYIFDYRDLSLEQKPLFAIPFKKVLSNSYANVISSPGFKKYLPIGFEYIVSHNFDTENLKKVVSGDAHPYKGDEINVLTIGALRVDMNFEIMDALGNKPGFKLSFVGKGTAAEYLENYAKKKRYNNIIFTGYYKKEDEPEIIEKHAMINIVYPLIPSHISALSNRFYNSLIYKRPMIVTKGTTQGDYAEQYNVGLVIDNCDNLNVKIVDYINSLDFNEFELRCNKLLELFLEENGSFVKMVKAFIIL